MSRRNRAKKGKPVKLCVVCSERGITKRANFFFLALVGTCGCKQARINTKSFGLCDSCCNPHGGNWERTKLFIAMRVWEARSVLLKKLEDQPSATLTVPDGKTAAAGGA